jgi:hypothetical protein
MDLAFGSNPVRLALDGQGHRNLLIPAGSETIPADQRPSVLRVQQQSLSFDGSTSSYLVVCCTESELSGEFDELVLDVLESIERSQTPAQDAAHSIGRWRRLFRASRLRGLTTQERLGLFAELSVLQALLTSSSLVGSSCWTGPDQHPHDFELPGECLEVKAIGVESSAISIHGVDQLDQHGERPLTLIVCTVLSDPDGQTLHELIESVRSQLPDEPLFTQQLAKAHWSVADAGSSTESYSVAATAVVPVTSGLPRLTNGSFVAGALPEGVAKVTYQVEVGRLLEHANGTSLLDVARALSS